MCRWALVLSHLPHFPYEILYLHVLTLVRKTHAQTLLTLLSCVHLLCRSSCCTLLSKDCCVSLCHVLGVVTNYPWHFNFLCTLTSLRCFLFFSHEVAALWSLLGLAGSGKAQVSFSLHTDFSQKRTQWLSETCCALCNLQQVFFSLQCPFSLVAVIFLCCFLLLSFSPLQIVSFLDRNSLLLWMVNYT